jgi:Ring finger domain
LLLINVILGFSYTFFPALIAITAILCLPCIYIFVRDGRLREEARQRALGASQSLINSIPIYKFRKQGQVQGDLESPVEVMHIPKKKRFRLFSKPKELEIKNSIIQKPKEWLEIEDCDANCSICLAEYVLGEEIRQLGCKHHYHVKCIDEWLSLNAVCPNCRGMDLVGSSSADVNPVGSSSSGLNHVGSQRSQQSMMDATIESIMREAAEIDGESQQDRGDGNLGQTSASDGNLVGENSK